MSAGVSNLGMGWDITRNPSTVVNGPDFYAQQFAALQAPTSPSTVLDGLISQQAQDNAKFYDNYAGYDGFVDSPNLHSADYWQQYLGQNIPAIAQNGNLTQSAMFAPQYVQQYQDATRQFQQQQADYNTQRAALAKQQEAATQNQQLQQQAYNQQNGGGFSGGLLNGSYAQPFSNVLGGNPSASQGFSGGMMGSGQAPAANTGLNPWAMPSTGSSPSTANSGAWGGPFSAKNPWSLS